MWEFRKLNHFSAFHLVSYIFVTPLPIFYVELIPMNSLVVDFQLLNESENYS
jgi:hypothetical protein